MQRYQRKQRSGNYSMVKKRGFSLIEALVAMGILSIFFAATAKIITTKPKAERVSYIHGSFKCCESQCYFKPPSGVAFFSIKAANYNYNSAYSHYEPNINNSFYINALSNPPRFYSTETGEEFLLNWNLTYSDFESYMRLSAPDENISNCQNGLVYISW